MQSKQTGSKKWMVPLLFVTALISLLISAVLAIALNIAGKRLDSIASLLDKTAEQHITADVALDTELPLNSNFGVAEDVTVGIELLVETTIPVNIEIPVNQNILVPFKIGVKDFIKLDTTIQITNDVYAMVEDTLYLDQTVSVPTSKKRGITLPIKASVPLNERVKVSVNQAIPVHAVVPVNLLIIDTLPVGLNIKVPVDVLLPVRIPVNTTATVSFPNPVPIVGNIPVSLTIPVDIPLSETDLAPYFINIAEGLRGLTKLSENK